jgi:hypothetical protein
VAPLRRSARDATRQVRRDGKLDITLRRPGAHMRILDGARRVYFALQVRAPRTN